MNGIVCETAQRDACYARLGPLFLGVQRQAIDNDQTQSLMESLAAHVKREGPGKVLLIYAPDAGPTAEQRRMIVDEYGDRTGIKSFSRVALLSNSTMVRGVLTALGWLLGGKSRTRAWKPSDWKKCLEWLHEGAAFDLAAAELAFKDVLSHCGYDFATATR